MTVRSCQVRYDLMADLEGDFGGGAGEVSVEVIGEKVIAGVKVSEAMEDEFNGEGGGNFTTSA